MAKLYDPNEELKEEESKIKKKACRKVGQAQTKIYLLKK